MLEQAITTALDKLQTPPEPINLDGRDMLVIRDDQKLIDLEPYQANPTRIRAAVSITDADSFVAYVNRFKNDDSVLFVTPDLAGVGSSKVIATARLDFHRPSGGGVNDPEATWGEHNVTLAARPSLAYSTLIELDGKLIDQPTFAKKLKDIARYAEAPSTGEMLEIAQNLVLTAKGEFRNIEDDISGSTDLRYAVAVNATANSPTQQRSLVIPATFDFGIPVLEGAAPQIVQCEFLYRIPESSEDKLKIGLRIRDRVAIEEESLRSVVVGLRQETGLMVIRGTYKSEQKHNTSHL